MSDNEREKLKQRRRALIKAAGAAPVVFSLANGSTAAAASLTCADKTKGASAPYVTSGTDGWVRVSVTQLKFKHGNDVWFGFLYGSTYYTVSGTTANVFVPPSGTQITPLSSSYYLLVDYTAPGVYGVYPSDASIGDPIAGASCWNSVNPNGPSAGAGNLI